MTHKIAPQMRHEQSSKFHWLFPQNADIQRRPSYDQPLWETPNFVVLPSLGSIVAGWLLVVPKKPISRIADLSKSVRGEFEELVKEVSASVQREYSTVYMFEHGGYAGSPISCGVDQAHLHIVPLDFDLLSLASKVNHGRWKATANRQMPYDFVGEHEYWFISSNNRTLHQTVTIPVSQFFRKLIATQLGCPDKWDYKKDRFLENVQDTVKVLGIHG